MKSFKIAFRTDDEIRVTLEAKSLNDALIMLAEQYPNIEVVHYAVTLGYVDSGIPDNVDGYGKS